MYHDNDGVDSPFQYNQNVCKYYEPDEFRALCNLESLKNTTYFHLNCRGLSSNWDAFNNLLCELYGDKCAFDFIGISEIFKTEGDMRLNLPGYHSLLSNCRDDGPRGGVGIFIKENINFSLRSDISVFLPHIFESIFVEVINQSGKNSVVGVIYRPNTEPLADFDIFETNLCEIISIINREQKHCVIMGDMNIDLLRFETHTKTDHYLENLFCNGFLPVIVKPTRITHSSATLIDHIYTNNITNKSHSGIIITDLADHFGTFHSVEIKPANAKKYTSKVRYFSAKNLSKFTNCLNVIDFTSVLETACPNQAYNTFMKLYTDVFNHSFPLREYTNKSKHVKREPWYSTGLLVSSKKKAKLFSKKMSKPTKLNISAYKEYNTIYNKLKRKMKILYYKTVLDENRSDIKKTWSILKRALGKVSDKSCYPNAFIINNMPVIDKPKAAEAFNHFFSNIGLQTSLNVPKSNKHFSSYMPPPIQNSIYIEPVSPSDVLSIAKKLKPKSSYGHDHISTKLLKESIEIIVDPITHIINRSFETGIVPDNMKTAKVIPIHKASDKSLLKNYRPISLLPAFSKLLEKLMYNKIISFLNSKDLFYKHQYGFRAKHSTVHPIIHLLNHCAEASSKPKSDLTMTIFCDLSKAFDVINHKFLLSKLNSFGIRGIANHWFHSYLTDRRQFVELDGHKSTYTTISIGVPQGSILGPLLYLIYVNDIGNSCNGNVLSFADDTTIYLSDQKPDQLYAKANIQINELFQWFCSNKLSLNASKTKYLVIRPKHLRYDLKIYDVYIGNTKLTRIGNDCDETSVKFLGIYLDENLTWKSHLSNVNNKISKALFSIKQLKNILPTYCLRSLYNSLIHSHLSYGILAWGNAPQSTLKQTLLLQKRAIRVVNNSRYNSHTDPLFQVSHVMKLNDIYEYSTALFMHDFISHNLPKSFNNIFTINRDVPNSRPTRQSELLYVARCPSQFASKLPLYAFPKLWNKWVKRVALTGTRTSAKRLISNFIFKNYPMQVKCTNLRCLECYN